MPGAGRPKQCRATKGAGTRHEYRTGRLHIIVPHAALEVSRVLVVSPPHSLVVVCNRVRVINDQLTRNRGRGEIAARRRAVSFCPLKPYLSTRGRSVPPAPRPGASRDAGRRPSHTANTVVRSHRIHDSSHTSHVDHENHVTRQTHHPPMNQGQYPSRVF